MNIVTAPAAYAGEGQVAGADLTACFGSRLAAQGLRCLDLGQVRHTVTPGTDEMNVGFGITVEPLHAVHSPQTDDQPLLFKQSQVSIHRSQGNIRIFRLKLGVNPVSRRVDIRGPQAG